MWKQCWPLNEISFLATPVEPVATQSPKARYLNEALAHSLGMAKTEQEVVRRLAHFQPRAGHERHLWALAYHGHQFQNYNPQLGDGRGFTFEQYLDNSGILRELGTKGSGQTPYSRSGDGRLTLKGAVREALASAQLNAFGVHSSHTLSIVETEQPLDRNDEPSPTRSAILVRVCKSHLRIGTFQRLRYLGLTDEIKNLVAYSQKYLGFSANASYQLWLSEVTERLARTTAEWMIFGFVHGVMNTDNINITGETFDFGPYRFLPSFDPEFTAAYFDHQKLYAFGQQPQIMVWNLHQLFLCIEPLESSMNFQTYLEQYQKSIQHWSRFYYCQRLLIPTELASTDPARIDLALQKSYEFMYRSKCDYQSFFSRVDLHLPILDEVQLPTTHTQNLPIENLLYDEIEHIWSAIEQNDNWAPFYAKLERLGAKNCLSS